MTANTSTHQVTASRVVEHLIAGQATSAGAGVKLNRVLTQNLQRRLDPFLMLDRFATDRAEDYIAGFPDHPHRGFETVTVMVEGRMRHRDSAGHEGRVGPGGVQWMTAGRGLVHSEMPEQQDGRMDGFQLWLNLPAREKMREPWYRDIEADQVPEWRAEGVRARVVAGRTHGVAGAVERETTEPLIVDLELAPGARFEQPLPVAHNAFVVVVHGAVELGGQKLEPGPMAILANRGDGIAVTGGAAGARLLLVAGRPLGEPIAQYGPFVMNSNREIFEAVEDFRAGRLA
jgi:redox-sensitive bicupin YhaK (pirin superfamily)